MICHMKVHIVSYTLDRLFFSKSKIHILPNYEQTDLKTAIVSFYKQREIVFSKFSCMFLNPNIFFQFELLLF